MFDATSAIQSVKAATPARQASSLLPLTVTNVSLSFGATCVLDGLSLSLNGQGCTAIMGDNGAGKSLVLRLLHGLIQPSSGQIDWNGLPATRATRRQALVFQTPVLLRRSVADNIAFALRVSGKDRAQVDRLLTEVGLSAKAKQPARLLSGGEAQRLALARALATEPEILLLDEPTASLDPSATRAIEAIVEAAKARGTRILLVTHDIGQAKRLAEDVVFLSNGQVAEHSSAKTFFATPDSEAAQRYIHHEQAPES